MLLARMSNICIKNNEGKSPLHEFCASINTARMDEQDKRQTLERLIARVDDVNTRDFAGATPLFDVLRTSEKHLPQILVDAGADVGVVNYLGQTALHIVAQHKVNSSTLC